MSTARQMDQLLRDRGRVRRRAGEPAPVDPSIIRRLRERQGDVDDLRLSRCPADETGLGLRWDGQYSRNMSRSLTVEATPDNPRAEKWLRDQCDRCLRNHNVRHNEEGD